MKAHSSKMYIQYQAEISERTNSDTQCVASRVARLAVATLAHMTMITVCLRLHTYTDSVLRGSNKYFPHR
jgi:hypothetical protein